MTEQEQEAAVRPLHDRFINLGAAMAAEGADPELVRMAMLTAALETTAWIFGPLAAVEWVRANAAVVEATYSPAGMVH